MPRSAARSARTGSSLALGLRDAGIVVIADAHTGEIQRYLRLGEPAFARDVQYSPDGQRLGTTTGNGRVVIWDVASAQPRFVANGHSGAVNALDWGPDSSSLVTVGDDGTARVWHVDDGGVRQQLVLSARDSRNGLGGVAFSPDGGRIVAGDGGVTASLIWDVRPTGAPEWLTVQGLFPYVSPESVDLTRDGATVLVRQPGRKVELWDVASGTRETQLDSAPNGTEVTRVAIAPDGRRVAMSNDEGPVTIRDRTSGDIVGEVPVEEAGGLAWSADGTALVVLEWLGDHDRLHVVDRNGRALATRDLPPGLGATAIDVSPDGRLVAVTLSATDRQDPDTMNADLWDWRRDEIVLTIDSDHPLLGVVFDPSGRRVALAHWLQGSVEVRDITTGERTATLTSKPAIRDMTFSPDGRLIFTANDDGQVRVWDATTGVQRGTIPVGPGTVWTLAISADGTRLATFSDDGTVRVLALDLDDLVAIAERRVTRPLDDDECRQFLHTDACPR